MHGLRWDKWELEVLKEKYPNKGGKIPEINRSKGAICRKAVRMNLIYMGDGRRWTDEETDLLRERYLKHGSNIPEINRSRMAICGKARALGIRKREFKSTGNRWTDREDEIIKREYPSWGSNISKLKGFGRSRFAIQCRANTIGVSSNARGYGNWSEEEIEKLREIWENPNITAAEVRNALKKRSKRAIHHKANRLGLKRPIIRSEKNTPLLKGDTTRFEKGFVVGMIEGEGTISLIKRRNTADPVIRISNTDVQLLKYCQKIIGGRIYKGNTRENRGDIYDLRIFRIGEVYETLKALQGSLISERKIKLCRLVIEFCESRMDRRKTSPLVGKEKGIIDMVRELNKRGKENEFTPDREVC